MSDPESLDLSAEDLMPAWVTGLENNSPTTSTFKPGQDENRDRRKEKGQGKRGGGNFERGDKFKKNDRRQGGRGKNDRRDHKRGPRDRRREDRQPVRAEDIVPQVEFIIEPTVESVKALVKHIRSTNRAYPIAEVAQMVLAASDRYRIIFRAKTDPHNSTKKKNEQGNQKGKFQMVRCKTDGSLWLSRDEAVGHFLNTPELLEKFYEVEEVASEAPKGNFSVIAICGLSNTILGPPNHHEYQQNITNLHRERFGNMPLEKFKSRIEMRRDEETIEQWKEQMSTSRHYRVRTEKPEGVAGKQNADTVETPVVKESISSEASEKPPADEGGVEREEETTETPVEGDAETSPLSDEPEVNPDLESTEKAESGEDAVTEVESEIETDDIESTSDENDDSGEIEESKTPVEEPQNTEPAITSISELTQHFREHFARKIFKEVGEARLPGSISKRELSPALCERMNAEINWQKRGFPLPMVRTLCRRFEHQGLKFFKRGSKALFVSASRPRSLSEDTVLTDRLVEMLNCIKEKPGTLAGDLIKHLLGKTEPATKESPDDPAQPSKKELALLADLRWLLAEGYLIEFPSSELIPGSEVTVNQRKRRPSKRTKKKRGVATKTTVDSKVENSQPATSPETSVSEPSEPSEPSSS